MVYITLVFLHRGKGTNRRKTVSGLYRSRIGVLRDSSLFPGARPYPGCIACSPLSGLLHGHPIPLAAGNPAENALAGQLRSLSS